MAKGFLSTMKNGVTSGSTVKSMSLLETFGAGAIGAGADVAMTKFLPNLSGWVKPVVEIGVGILAGSLLKNEFGKLTQSGMVITGMNSFSNYAVSAISSMISAKTTTTSNSSSGSVILY